MVNKFPFIGELDGAERQNLMKENVELSERLHEIRKIFARRKTIELKPTIQAEKVDLLEQTYGFQLSEEYRAARVCCFQYHHLCGDRVHHRTNAAKGPETNRHMACL